MRISILAGAFLFLLTGCGNETIVGLYSFYDEYDRPGRHFERVVACNPSQRGSPFVSGVDEYMVDDNAIHMHVVEPDKAYYVIILSRDGGFNCTDDERIGPFDRSAYVQICDSLEIPILMKAKS